MPDLPFDPPPDDPPQHKTLGQATVVGTDSTDKTTQHYSHRDILAMYPSLRLDHLRYLEKCGLLKPVYVNGSERYFAFTDLTAFRQIAGELQQGSAFRAVVRNLHASRAGQLRFDFRLGSRSDRSGASAVARAVRGRAVINRQDDSADLHLVASLDLDVLDDTRNRRGHFDGGLIGFELDDRLLARNGVAHLDEHTCDVALFNVFPQLGNFEFLHRLAPKTPTDSEARRHGGHGVNTT